MVAYIGKPCFRSLDVVTVGVAGAGELTGRVVTGSVASSGFFSGSLMVSCIIVLQLVFLFCFAAIYVWQYICDNFNADTFKGYTI